MNNKRKKCKVNYFASGGDASNSAATSNNQGANQNNTQQGQNSNLNGVEDKLKSLNSLNEASNSISNVIDLINTNGLQSNLGNAIKAIPGLGAVGSVVNLLGGSTIDKNKIKSIDNLSNSIANYNYDTSSTEGFLNDSAQRLDLSHYSKHDLGGHDSLFNHSARKKTNALNDRINTAQILSNKNYELSGNNLTQNNAFGVMANYSALGGYVPNMFTTGGTGQNNMFNWLSNNSGNIAGTASQLVGMANTIKGFGNQKIKPQANLQSVTQGGNGIASFALGATYNILDSLFGKKPNTLSNAMNSTTNYFANGGTWDTVNKYAGMANDALSIINNAVAESKLDFNTDKLFNSMKAAGNKYDNMNIGSTQDLLKQAGQQREMSYLNAGDFRANNKGGWGNELLDSFGNSINGFNLGSKTGNPYAAAAGAIVGGASSLIGSVIGRKKAENAAKKQHKLADYVNTRMFDNTRNASENLQGTNIFNSLARQYALGGNMFEDGGTTPTLNALTNNINTTSNIQQNDYNMNKAQNNYLTVPLGSPTLAIPNYNNYYNNGEIIKADGGTISTNGSDFNIGSISIDTGGRHETNINGGVQIGTDPNGNPNLVEQGEIVLNSGSQHPFVLSNRLTVPSYLVDKYNLKKGSTYAQAYKKITKEGNNRPNDPLSKKLRESVGQELAQVQEEQKMIEKMKQIAQLLGAMQQAGIDPNQLMQQQANQEQQAQEQQLQEQQAQEAQAQGQPYGNEDNTNGEQVQQQDYPQAEQQSGEELNGIDPNKLASAIQPGMAAFGGKLTNSNLFPNGGSPINSINQQLNNGLSEAMNKAFEQAMEKADVRGKALKDFIENTLIKYKGSLKAGRGRKTKNYNPDDYYGIDTKFNLGKEKTVKDYENTPEYKAFTNYVLEHPNHPMVQKYLKEMDNYTGNKTNKYFNKDGKLREDWKEVFTKRRTDGKLGINHLNPFANRSDASLVEDIKNPSTALWPSVIPTTPQKLNNINTAVSSNQGDVRDINLLPTWMRYVPAVGLGLGVLTDALGITGKPDYAKIDDAYNRIGNALAEWSKNTTVHPYHIGDYMAPYQVDHLGTNALIQNTAAANRLASNIAGGNRAQALGSMFANNFQFQRALAGQRAAENAENHNYYAKQMEFNKDTNKFNANMDFNAENATKSMKGQFAANVASIAPRMASLYMDEKRYADTAKSKNLSLFLDSLGSIGKENLYWNMANTNPYWRLGYEGNNGKETEIPQGWSPAEWTALNSDDQLAVRQGKKKKSDFTFNKNSWWNF